MRDAFLALHRLRGKCLLPAVISLEAIAEVAVEASGQPVIGFRNVDMIDGVTFHTDDPSTLHVRATQAGAGVFECLVSGDVRSRAGKLIQKDRPYLSGSVEVASVRPALKAEIAGMAENWVQFTYPDDAPMYHGAPFRGATAGCGVSDIGGARVVALPLVDLVGAERVGRWDGSLGGARFGDVRLRTAPVGVPRQLDRHPAQH